MTTLPLTLAMTAMSLTSTIAFGSSNADLDNNGNVDTADLIVLTNNLNQYCDGACPTDLNGDYITDILDVLELMQQWGPVEGYVSGNSFESDSSTSLSNEDEERDMSWQGQDPVLLDAIYYDQYTRLFSHGGYARWHNAEEYNQGEHTMEWTAQNNVAVQPMVYGSVDWDHDNVLSDEDRANFVIWLDETIPTDYDGPICLDLEGQWWSMLDSSNQGVVDVVIDVYLEHIEYAKSLRPNAKIGFWGLPKKSHTNPDSTSASVDRLLDACTAIFPDVYENNPGGNDKSRLRTHIERAIEKVNGQVPVYVQTSPRHKNDSGVRVFHDQQEFMRDQVQSALDAVWTDSSGVDHGISGIALWDAYNYVAMYTEGWSEMSMETRKEYWDEVDFIHIEFLSGMKSLVDVAGAVTQGEDSDDEQPLDQKSEEVVLIPEFIELTPPSSSGVVLVELTDQQRTSRLVGTVGSMSVPSDRAISASSSSQITSKSYRDAQSSWTRAKQVYSAAMRRYLRGTNQYKQAVAAYRDAQEQMRLASEEYVDEHEEYLTSSEVSDSTQSKLDTDGETSHQTILAQDDVSLNY